VFSSLGRFCYRRRRLVALAWLVLLVAGFLGGGRVFDRLVGSGAAASSESIRGFDVLAEASPYGGRILALVDGAPVDDPAVQAAVTDATSELADREGVGRVLTWYATQAPALRATDGRASLIAVDLAADLDGELADAAQTAVEERLRALGDTLPAGGSVRLGGEQLVFQEATEQVERDLRRGESVALPIVLVVMVVIFGGVVAAGIPFLAAIASVAGALLSLLGFSYLLDLDPSVVSVATVMGLGLSIDYALLMVSRYREERGAGLSPESAVERATATAGRTIFFSALTVATSLCGLFLYESAFFHAIGVAGVSVVLVALLAGVTLTPALIALFGRRIKVPTEPVPDDGFFARLARGVQRRPVLVTAGVAALLLATAAPFLGARYQNGGADLLPEGFEGRQVAEAVEQRFPGSGAEPVMVVARVAAERLTAYGATLADLPDVATVGAATQLGGGVSALDVVPLGRSQGEQARSLVAELRELRPDYPTYVTGEAAFLVDFRHEVVTRTPYALGFIALATFVLLFLMTGSVLVPIKALVMNTLSLGASFGALVLIFQEGFLAGLLGFTATGALETWIPVIVFVFAFGLSMDYEVFLLSRVKELYDAGYPNDRAVELGLQRSGRIITSAALLVFIVFTGFATGELIDIKQLGIALAIAVFVDATLVRCLLVPATMTLLGDRNWWAPGPLRRLHNRFGLREHAPAPRPAGASTPAPVEDRV